MSELLLVANWKMYGSLRTNLDYIVQLASIDISNKLEICLCPPVVYLHQFHTRLSNLNISVGAQDISMHLSKGAFTGDISGEMLADFNCSYVIVGHSERRMYQSESDQVIGIKASAAVDAGITPIICIGETLKEREANQTFDAIEDQLYGINQSFNFSNFIIAYEPVWAIGTGLTPSPDQVQAVHSFIRTQLPLSARNNKIVYGGSVNKNNFNDLTDQEDVDGCLIGSASLDIDVFKAIIQMATNKFLY